MNYLFKNIIETKNFLTTVKPDYDINISRVNISTCPYCNSLQSMGLGINNIIIIEEENQNRQTEVNRTCVNKNCNRSFVDIFDMILNNNNQILFNKYRTLTNKEFDVYDFILFFVKNGEKDIFARFYNLYTEANEALNNGMEEASGMLLRKALEALIIDYIRFGARIKGKTPKEMRFLETQGLMKCVEMIEDVSLKELSIRAVWIGNDNVHTKKKWSRFDSDDLNRLLGAIVLNIYSKIECLIYLRKMSKRY